jgi:hypothetical protein
MPKPKLTAQSRPGARPVQRITITVYTLAYDTRDGTGAYLSLREADIRRVWLDLLDVADDERRKAPKIDSDEWLDFVDEHKIDFMDTFSWEEAQLKVPLYSTPQRGYKKG